MTSIFIDGEAGTTGLKIRDRLKDRKDIKLLSIKPERRKDASARRDMLNSADVAILCLPDEAAIEAVALVDEASKTRIIDASSAHRVAEGWTYGMPELDGKQPNKIAVAKRVTNPGCWPQGLIALARPLIAAEVMPRDYPATYHGVSGYSGGGKKMIAEFESGDAPAYLPYGLTFKHKHLPEMKAYAGLARDVLFEPVVGHFAQGMQTTLSLFADLLAKKITARDVHDILSEAYDGCRFIEVASLEPIERSNDITPEVLNGTNRMRLHVFGNDALGQISLMAIYDNLGKGASGAAVQCLNIMIGADEGLSVDLRNEGGIHAEV
jgi:N-acetyl-gamma-glutamyl-phosphate reductase